jgi:hypothetical protein
VLLSPAKSSKWSSSASSGSLEQSPSNDLQRHHLTVVLRKVGVNNEAVVSKGEAPQEVQAIHTTIVRMSALRKGDCITIRRRNVEQKVGQKCRRTTESKRLSELSTRKQATQNEKVKVMECRHSTKNTKLIKDKTKNSILEDSSHSRCHH